MHLLDRDNIAIIARLELQEHRHEGTFGKFTLFKLDLV